MYAGMRADSLIRQVFVVGVRADVVRVEGVDELLVREHPRVRLLGRLDLSDQQLAEPSFADVLAFRRLGQPPVERKKKKNENNRSLVYIYTDTGLHTCSRIVGQYKSSPSHSLSRATVYAYTYDARARVRKWRSYDGEDVVRVSFSSPADSLNGMEGLEEDELEIVDNYLVLFDCGKCGFPKTGCRAPKFLLSAAAILIGAAVSRAPGYSWPILAGFDKAADDREFATVSPHPRTR